MLSKETNAGLRFAQGFLQAMIVSIMGQESREDTQKGTILR